AALLEFDAYGIEISSELVEAARELADDFDLPAEFIHGSFIPPDTPVQLERNRFSWLATDGHPVRNETDLGPDDFNVIFAYPWPDEETALADLFDCHAMPGAVLLSYHGDSDLRLRRKVVRRSRR
ncbi:MAG: class I SAM-dependent methyltransferase, partial [Gemmataceae bacterium]